MSMPGDMHVDVVGHPQPVHLRAKHRVLEDEIFRHDAGAQHLASAVDVLDVVIERLDPLLETGAQPRPFLSRDDARQDVEGDQALG